MSEVLAIDGALGAFTCALDDGTSVATRTIDPRSALERGLDAISELLAERRVRLTDLDRIAVGIGPGGFTGLRIALSFAKSLALAARRPLVGVSSYDALTPDDAPLPLAVFVSGRTGVTCVRLSVSSNVKTMCGPVTEIVERMSAEPSREWYVVASTEDVLAGLAERGKTVQNLARRADIAAAAIASLARWAPLPVSPHAVRPEYGELPAVTLAKGALAKGALAKGAQ